MNNLKSAHYFSLPSQGNIYTLTKLHLTNGSSKLLAASLKREVFCFEYVSSPSGMLIPTVKEVSFTYIPSECKFYLMSNPIHCVSFIIRWC